MLQALFRNATRRADDTPATPANSLLAAGADGVEVAARQVVVGDDHAATLVITGYAAEVGAAWPEPLMAYPGRIDVSWHIEPVPPAVAADRLKRQRARLESARRQDAAKARLDDPELDAAAEDAAELAQRVARGEGRLFRVGLYLTVHAADRQELAERVTEVRALASSLLLEAVPVTWRQLQGWTATLPLAVDALDMRRTFDTAALAAAFPFTSPDLAGGTGTGVFFGLNAASAGVVVWDRWAQDNHNMVILARSGAGKSYLAKLDLLRNLYQGVEAAVIDPEDEYVDLAEAVGGVVIRPGTPGVRINPLDIALDGAADALTRRALFAHTFTEVLLGAPLSAGERAALDTAVLAAYRQAGITFDPRTWRRPAPLLRDVAAQLPHTGDAGQLLAARLAPYVTGSFKELFDGPTSVHSDGHLVVYAIRDLPDELKAVGTLLTLDAIGRRIAAGDRAVPKLVLVDEAWLLLRDGEGAKFLLRLAKSARKYHAGLTVITQDAADVLATDTGRAVVSNAATQILLRQAPQAIDALTDAFALTDGERAWLLSAGRGQALLAAGAARVTFTSLASDDVEHQIVSSSPPAARR